MSCFWCGNQAMDGRDGPLMDDLRPASGIGKKIPHAKLRSADEFRERRLALARIIEAAAQLNRQ